MTLSPFTEEHDMLRETIGRWVDTEIAPNVAAWEEAGDLYTEKEQAALRLTEAITVLSSHEYVSDEVYERAAKHFDEEELAQLIALIFTINSWNRIAVSTRKRPDVR